MYNDYVNSSAYPVWIGFTVTQELLKREDPWLPIFANLPDVTSAGYRGRPMTLLGTEKPRYAFDSTAKYPMFFQSLSIPSL